MECFYLSFTVFSVFGLQLFSLAQLTQVTSLNLVMAPSESFFHEITSDDTSKPDSFLWNRERPAYHSRQLPPKVVGGAIGGGLGGGIGGGIGGGVGYLFGGPIGGGIGGAIGGGPKGTGGLIGGKIGGGNGAALGAAAGGAIGGGVGGFVAGPIGGGLGGLLLGGLGGGAGAAYLPDDRITHEEDVPGFPKRNLTSLIIKQDDTDLADTLPFESKSNFADRLRQRIFNLRLRVTNAIKGTLK